MTFEELDLNDNILDALWDMNFSECTPVQEQCIPHILSGRDIIGIAQTGTGKTAAYLLPILNMLDDDKTYPEDERLYPDDAINCVIMSPTRELAQQIDQAMQGFSYYMPEINSVAVYGGNDGNRYNNEQKALSLGADMIIATPGRLISHIQIGNVDFSRVSFFVLDEADRMLDMGFADDIKKIASLLPPTCQTIMFSATMPDKIEDLAKTLLHNPVMVKLAVSKPAEKIHQQAYICHEDQKVRILKNMFQNQKLQRVIIFASSKIKCKELRIELLRMKVNCDEMHSDLSQAERDEVMFRFKSGQTDVLVATDIVARGIDIDDIAMVINYDVPRDVEDYVHRIGRTARADRDGEAITLVRGWDISYFMEIEKFLEKSIEKLPLPDGMEGPEYKALKGKPRKPGKKGKPGGGRKPKGKQPRGKQSKAKTSDGKQSAKNRQQAKKHPSKPKQSNSKQNTPQESTPQQ